jgi:hypothetical protein
MSAAEQKPSRFTIQPLNELTSIALNSDGVDDKTNKSPIFRYNADTLTMNAISEKLRARVPRVEQSFQDSENQAEIGTCCKKKFGSWEPGLLPLEGM